MINKKCELFYTKHLTDFSHHEISAQILVENEW